MNKEILRLAIPNIISNISIPLLSTVDTILMGHLSARHLGAVGIGAMIYNFLYWNFGFLRMGTTGITAQNFGKKDQSEIIHTLLRALTVAVILAISIMLLCIPINWIASKAFNILPEQQDLVNSYYYIRILAAPATLSLFALNGWFFGMQNAMYPLYITLITNVLNIIISFFCVQYLNMATAGVAWGTVIGQYVGCFAALYFIKRSYQSYFNYYQKELLFQWDKLKNFLSINSDIFIRTVFLTIAFSFFYSQSSSSGELILAVNVILLQLINWMSYGIDGFAFAAESMVGKYKGAEDDQKLKRSIVLALLWGGALALLYALVYGFAFKPILLLFTPDLEVVQLAQKYFWWIVVFPIASFLCYIWDGIFIGLTAAKSMRNSIFIAFILYMVCYYGFRPIEKDHAIWLALFVFVFSRGILQSFLYLWKGKNLV